MLVTSGCAGMQKVGCNICPLQGSVHHWFVEVKLDKRHKPPVTMHMTHMCTCCCIAWSDTQSQTDMPRLYTFPVKVSPEVYLEVKMAGSLSKVIEGSVQFRIFVGSEESRNWDSLKVHSPQEKVSDAEGPATYF